MNYDGTPTFTIKASAGHYIADVLVDGVSVGPVATYKFAGVKANHTISATFAAGVQTGLWISTAQPVVSYGRSTLLRGELYDVRDPVARVGLAGRLVIVQFASSPTAPLAQWQSLGTFTTSSPPNTPGQFSLNVSPKAPTYYRLRYLTEPLSEYGGSVSDVKGVGVRPALGRPVVPKSVKAGQRFTAYGSLKPGFTAGQKTVKLDVFRYKNGRWVRVKALSATNVASGGSTQYRLKTKLTTKSKYRFRASTAAAGGWAAATTSFSTTLVVK